MSQARQPMMRLGLFVDTGGHHVAAWRDPSVEMNWGLEQFVQMARTAERCKFDMLFSADTNAAFGADDAEVWCRSGTVLRLEPMTLLGALAACTERIGLVATMTTTYFEPFHVARFFATLDQISKGRGGWNLVTSVATSEALNFGRESHLPHAERYARAREFVDVVFGLWDSFEDNAMLYDKGRGFFFDPEKLHFLRHHGKHFNVRGPLMVRRSPQGRPILVQAGQSEDGRNLSAECAEVIFTVQQEIEGARAFYKDIKERAAKFGRNPDHVKVLPGVMTVIGRTKAEAEDKYAQLQDLISPEVGVKQLSSHWGMDLSKYPLDGPVPEPKPGGEIGRVQLMVDLAKRENMSIRQLYQRVVGQRAHCTVIGTPVMIADMFEEWFVGGACDGFNMLPLTFPQGLDDFANGVIPELQRRGLFRTEYEGRTLRENLGLPKPENRWAREPHHPIESAAE